MSLEVKKLLRQIMKGATNPIPQSLFMGKVTDVQTETCTVTIDEFEIPEVRLRAAIAGNPNRIIAAPRVGSFVLIGSLNGDYTDMAVLVVDEIEKLEYEQNGLKLSIDSTDGKISISNGNVSLLELFQDLKTLILALKVTTPSGPSTNLLPASRQALQSFETKFKQLLK